MMGCTQSSERFLPPTQFPIGRFYDNRGYPKIRTPPMVMVTGSPTQTPMHMKSALKKTDPDEQGRLQRYPFPNRKPLGISKSVNFDEQVEVKARTPSPNKTWYDRDASTVPIKEFLFDDDDEDFPSDNELDYNDQIYADPHVPRLGTPTSLLQEHRASSLWQKRNATEHTLSEDNLMVMPGTRIKVRRRLPHGVSSQMSPASSHDPVNQHSTDFIHHSSAHSLLTAAYRQTPAHTLGVSGYRIRAKPPVAPVYHIVPKHTTGPVHPGSTQLPVASTQQVPMQLSVFHTPQTSVQSSIVSAQTVPTQARSYPSSVTNSMGLNYQDPGQSSATSTYQNPAQVPIIPTLQISAQGLGLQTSTISANQPRTQPPTGTTQSHQTVMATTSTPIEHKSMSSNGDSRLPLGFHPFKRPPAPLGTVT